MVTALDADLPECCAAVHGAEVMVAARERRLPSASVLRAHMRSKHPEAWREAMGGDGGG